MKILLATTSYPRKNGDTAGIFVHNLAIHLKKQGANIKVVTPSCGMSDEQNVVDSITVHRFRYFFKRWEVLFCRGGGAVPALKKKPYLHAILPFALFFYALSILKYSEDVDVIQAEWSISGFAAILAKVIRKKKIVVSLLGSDMMKAKSSFIYRFVTKLAFKYADFITSVSKRMVNEAVSFGADKSKVMFLPYGTGEEFLKIKPPEFQKPFNLLFIGNLIPLKRVHVIIKALAGLPDYFRLHIVGDGPMGEELKTLVRKLSLENRVFFEGRKPHKEIPEYLSHSHALLLLSESEGRPNVVLEALAAGVPVIVSDIPGNRELVVDMENGIVVPVDDVQATKKAILALFSSEEKWEVFSKAAKRFVIEERLLWKNTAEDHIKLYKNIVS